MSEEQKEKWYNSFTREQLIERCEYLQRSCERKENSIMELEMEYADLESIIKEVREKVNNFDVFKEFTFPLMKRDVENQVKSSIDYEWRKSIKEPILEILDKEKE